MIGRLVAGYLQNYVSCPEAVGQPLETRYGVRDEHRFLPETDVLGKLDLIVVRCGCLQGEPRHVDREVDEWRNVPPFFNERHRPAHIVAGEKTLFVEPFGEPAKESDRDGRTEKQHDYDNDTPSVRHGTPSVCHGITSLARVLESMGYVFYLTDVIFSQKS